MLRNLMERYKQSGYLEKLYGVISVIFRLTHGPREILLRAKTRILNEGKRGEKKGGSGWR